MAHKRIRGFRSRALLMALIVLMMAFPPINSVGKTTQQQLNEAEREKENLQNELDEKNEEIDGLKGNISALQRKLQELNTELEEVSARLEDLEQQIMLKETEIEVATEQLRIAIETKEQQYADMKARIQFIYERGETVYLQVLFEAKSFSDLLTRADYITKLEEYDRKMLTLYEETCADIEDRKANLELECRELEDLREEARQEREHVEEIIASTSNYVAVYKDQVEEAERAAREYEEALRKKEEDIEYLKKKLEEERRLAELAAKATTRDISSVTFEEGDRYLLANLIYCEAGGEIYAGKLAVGAVVINRLLNGAFPNTIYGVIYQKNQFSPVGSGRYALALAQNRATASCYRAADEAMSGATNVGGCLFFRTPTPSKTPVYVIGGHIFY